MELNLATLLTICHLHRRLPQGRKEGEYTFEIWSDDGGKLYLHNELVITNDGPHGTEGKFGKAILN